VLLLVVLFFDNGVAGGIEWARDRLLGERTAEPTEPSSGED
jgi:hypothetical protein